MMTFHQEDAEPPLSWGAAVFNQRIKPIGKTIDSASSYRPSASGKTKGHRLNLQQKKYVITSLLLVNSLIIGATVSKGQTSRVQEVRSVQAILAPTPMAESVQIHPVQAPVAVEASIATEVAQPTPAPTEMVAAASVTRPALAPAVGNWDSLLQQYFGDAWVAAKKVMLCESGGNANAIGPWNPGGTRPYGLMQIMALPGRPSPEWLLNAANNISYAAGIYHAQGWRPWSCKSVLGL